MMENSKEEFYFSSLSQEELRKMQIKLLNILEVFDDFCRKNNLRYYLAAGTCLGAVRHKGFIPWDDDLDVSMPRDDFERLFKLWNNKNNRYQLLRPSQKIITGVHIGLLRDSDTTCIYEYARNHNICHGMKIDIEVLDGCPSNPILRKIQRFYGMMYAILSAQRIPNNGSSMRKKLAKVILGIIKSRKVRFKLFSFALKNVKRYRMDKSDLVRVAYSPLVFRKEVFGTAVMKEFEGRKYPVPTEYDIYLKKMYNNYMQLPPKSDRKAHTKCFFYDPDTPYIKYYGKKYCTKQK